MTDKKPTPEDEINRAIEDAEQIEPAAEECEKSGETKNSGKAKAIGIARGLEFMLSDSRYMQEANGAVYRYNDKHWGATMSRPQRMLACSGSSTAVSSPAVARKARRWS